MGLLIKLQNGDTQLKSLKFGKDRPGGGDSGQPYIQNTIDGPSQNPDYYNDFVLRGGIEAPISAVEDVNRLTKYLASPKGLLFITKQQLLSRTGTKTEASKGIQYLGGGLNEGIYNPLNTLAQAGTGFLGAHFDKQETRNYQDIIIRNQPKDNFTPDTNRLTRLTELITVNRPEFNFSFVKGYSLNANNSLISYGGGPNSDLGVGKTYINFATSNYGDPDSIKTLLPKPEGYLTPNKDYYIPSGSVYQPGQYIVKTPDKYLGDEFTDPTLLIPRKDLTFYLTGKTYKNKANDENWQLPISASLIYNSLSTQKIPIEKNQDNPNYLTLGYDSWEYNFFPSIYKLGTLTPIDNYKTYLTKEDPDRTKSIPVNDFAQASYESSSIEYKIIGKQGYNANKIQITIISGSSQFTFQDPTLRKFTEGKTPIDFGKYKPYSLENGAEVLYDSNTINSNINNKEIIPFIITVVSPQNPTTNTASLQFPAYVESFTDNYNADWNSQTYMGRAEKFYKYNSFSRDISFTFRVAATSEANLEDNYKKLNKLAASLAPTYTSQGYMAGNLHRLTFGNYVKGQYGILESVDYTIMDESPWETEENNQLPFYIEVSCKFTPIHNFRPESFIDTKFAVPFINQSVSTI